MNNLNIIMAERRMDKKVEESFKKLLKDPNFNPSTLYNHGVFLYK